MVSRYFLRTFILSYSFLGLSLLGIAPAFAQANILRECDSKYRAAKVANELAGQNWQAYLKACRTKMTDASKPADNFTLAQEQPHVPVKVAPGRPQDPDQRRMAIEALRRVTQTPRSMASETPRAAVSITTPNRHRQITPEEYREGLVGEGQFAM